MPPPSHPPDLSRSFSGPWTQLPKNHSSLAQVKGHHSGASPIPAPAVAHSGSLPVDFDELASAQVKEHHSGASPIPAPAVAHSGPFLVNSDEFASAQVKGHHSGASPIPAPAVARSGPLLVDSVELASAQVTVLHSCEPPIPASPDQAGHRSLAQASASSAPGAPSPDSGLSLSPQSLSLAVGALSSMLPGRPAFPVLDVCAAFLDPAFASTLHLEFADQVFAISAGEDPLGFDPAATLAADNLVRTHGLLAALQTHIDDLRSRGPSLTSLASKFAGIGDEALHRRLFIHGFGSDLYTQEGWRPNAGQGFSQSSSIADNMAVVTHKAQQFVAAGRCLIVSRSALSADDWLQVHLNHLLSVPKPNDPSGRLCLAPTNGSAELPSLNSGIDKPSHDALLPLSMQPNVASISEMLCGVRDNNPGEKIFGASADVKAAHQQPINTPRKAAVMASLIGDKVLFFLTGYFGECRAGHDYEPYRVAIDAAHNAGQPYTRSKTYSDDGLLANIESRIHADLTDYVQLIIDCFGPLGFDPEKLKIWEEALVAIGFHFDLRLDVWRVAPKESSRRKIAHALLCRIPPDCSSVPRKTLHSVAGLLCWHSQVLPAGKSFLHCLFNDLTEGADDPLTPGNVILGCGSLADLEVWRGLAAILTFDPHFLGASIDVCRESKTPSLHMRADASGGLGCGGFLSPTRNGKAIAACSVQWTTEELKCFARLKISINTLEFFAFLLCLLVWSLDVDLGALLRDAVIAVELDNTAAISYLLKQRANSKTSAHCIVRLYSVAMALFGWSIDTSASHHLAGVLNDRADALSRIRDPIDFSDPSFLLRFQADPSPSGQSLAEDIQKVSTSSNGLWIAAQCRQLLLDCIVSPESMPLPTQVGRLRLLASMRGSGSAR